MKFKVPQLLLEGHGCLVLGSCYFELQSMLHFSIPHRTYKECCVLRWMSWKEMTTLGCFENVTWYMEKYFLVLGLFVLEKGRLRDVQENCPVCGTSAMSRK